jgi:Tol biopolymer transport system component
LLLKGEHYVVPFDWSRDGRYLLYAQYGSASSDQSSSASFRGQGSSNEEIWALPLRESGKPFLVVKTGFTQAPRHHSLSPNGRWLAYTSAESGKPEVFVMPFGAGQGKWQISQDGGESPFWSSDGRELFYRPSVLGAAINAVPVSESGNTIVFGPPHTLFNESNVQRPVFDVAPGGKKFLDARVIQQTSQPITVISNWSAELKK